MAGRDIKKEKEKIRQLLAKGKEKGMLSYEEIMDSLSSTELSPEQIDDVYEQISAMGIKLVHAESEKDKSDLDEEENILTGCFLFALGKVAYDQSGQVLFLCQMICGRKSGRYFPE